MDLGVYTLLLDKPKWIPWHLKNPFEAWGALFRRLRHKKGMVCQAKWEVVTTKIGWLTLSNAQLIPAACLVV